MKGYTCDGQMSIFDILGQEPAKPKQQGYDYSNPILNHMLEELKEIFTVTEIKYEVWDHVPNLGKRMNATLKDLPDVWDITEMMDRYLKDYELELSTTIWDPLSGEKEIWLSTMWITKGHKERTDWKEETEKPQVAAVKYECGEWVKEHGQRVLFEDIETDKYYIHDYSTVSHESFKVVYTKRKTEDAIMYVDSPRGIKAEWSWGNTFSALSRKEWVNGEESGDGWFYEMPTEGKQMGWPLDIRGLCDDGYCPNCDHAFDQYLHPDEIDCEVCPECGTPLDWTRWHKMNDPELKDKYQDLDTRYINPDTREIEDHPFEWNYTDTDPPKIEDIYFGCIISKDNAGEDMYTYTTIRFMDGVYWIFNHSNKEWLTLAKGDTVIAWREYTSSELNTIRDYDSMVIHEIEEEDGERDQEDM